MMQQSPNVGHPLRVAIATTTRFHVTDLARELIAQGMEVQYLSYVPKARAVSYGVPETVQSSILAPLAPVIAWERFHPKLAPKTRASFRAWLLNRAVIARLKPCDVFICMSGDYLEAAEYARRKFGAQIWLERGSTHILAQKDILAGVPGARVPSDLSVAREQAGYALADRILVGSTHVRDSFLDRAPEFAEKLLRIPYGVNTDEFPLLPRQPAGPPWKLLMVGGWSLRKGCDVLIKALEGMDDIAFTHVGGLGDCPFPHDDPRFTHVGMVSQSTLTEHYAQAHLAVLASREEGLAMVQAQSLASGLPLVCTTMTGGQDLRLSPRLERNIFVCPDGDPDILRVTIRAAINAYAAGQVPALQEEDRALLTWQRYGMDYGQTLRNQVSVARSIA